MIMHARPWHLSLILLMAAVPVAMGAGAAGDPVTPADRALVVKQLGADAADFDDPAKDLDITKIDLNDDKHADYIVVTTNSLCGSGGCAAWIFMSDGTGYRNVAPAILVFGLAVADTRTRNVRDLIWSGRGNDVRLIWNGKNYERADGKK
jgi:hypothetical protein